MLRAHRLLCVWVAGVNEHGWLFGLDAQLNANSVPDWLPKYNALENKITVVTRFSCGEHMHETRDEADRCLNWQRACYFERTAYARQNHFNFNAYIIRTDETIRNQLITYCKELL